jgi:hypothetical protein
MIIILEMDIIRNVLDQDLRCKQAGIIAITGIGFQSTVLGKVY